MDFEGSISEVVIANAEAREREDRGMSRVIETTPGWVFDFDEEAWVNECPICLHHVFEEDAGLYCPHCLGDVHEAGGWR